MLITTIEELRLALPTHAMDDISQLTGFIENSEVDFLKEKLGDALYERLKEIYKQMEVPDYLQKIFNNETLMPWEKILMQCQRCVAFDAMGRAVSVQAISLNNAGINVSTSDDYEKVDKATVADYKQQCNKEAHAGVNYLLQTLENMACYVQSHIIDDDTKEEETEEDDTEVDDDNKDNDAESLSQQKEIVGLWEQSRYYFLANSLLLPSANILQEFVNIYDNREKFIQLLPDLHYVQEEQLVPAIGEDLIEYLVSVSIKGTQDKLLARIIYKLRKALASGLEARTTILNIKQARQQQAHDELVGYLKTIGDYIGEHQDDFPEEAQDAIKASPCYREPKDEMLPKKNNFKNRNGNAIFVTPIMR